MRSAAIKPANTTRRHSRIPVDEYPAVIRAHEGLVRAVARDYHPPPGTGTDDLLQEGRIGLWKACRDYRPDAGAPFRAFAALCIRRQILTALIAATREKHRAVNTATSMAAPIGEDGTTIEDTVASAHQLEDLVVQRERAAHALAAVAAIPDHYQGPLIEVDVRGLTYAEVVAARGFTNRKSLDNLLQRARRAVRDQAA